MKNLLLVLLSLTVSSAQIVDIPDPNFKAALLAINGLGENAGEIQISEAGATYAIVADNSKSIHLFNMGGYIPITHPKTVETNDLLGKVIC
mgnify:CR=1 FL=1